MRSFLRPSLRSLSSSSASSPASWLPLWITRLATFFLWALAAASAAFWFLQNDPAAQDGKAPAAPAVLANQDAEQNLTPQVAAALGAKNPVAPTEAGLLAALQARLQLQGVLAVGTAHGAALISVDGKPAKPYRVGSSIEDGLEVTSVKARSVSIGTNGSEAFTLELPLQK